MRFTSLPRNTSVSAAAHRLCSAPALVESSASRIRTARATSRTGQIRTTPYICAGILLTTATASAFERASPAILQLRRSSTGASGQEDEMSQKLVPQHPEDVMVIRNVTPNIVTLSVPFSRAGLLKIGGRGTIVKLTSGSLAVFSPVALTPAVQKKLTEMGGQVRYLIAPDIEHHIFLSDWKKAFPDAKLIGPEGLPEKRHKAKDEKIGDEPFAVVFTAKDKRAVRVDAEFDADFEYEFVNAHANKELVFLYKPDRVMIEADLFFNLPPTEQYSRVPDGGKPSNVAARLFASLQSPKGDAKGMKRLIWYALSASDRKGFNDSIAVIDKWDFDTIIPCHGDVMQGDGRQVFEKVFEWHLAAAKAQQKA